MSERQRTEGIAAGPEAIVKVVAAITERCHAAGLDLVAVCAAEDYNREVDPLYRLPDFGRPRALVIVVGNTRALWDVIRAARAPGGPLAGARDPFDRHAEGVVRAAVDEALREHAPGAASEVRFSPEPPPRRVAMQRLAAAAGLAWLSSSHMCIHPTYGPWFALRAAIVIDVDGPAQPPARLAPPCDCATGCAPALAEALAGGVPTSSGELRPRWKTWLAVRDACPVGREHRYGEAQLRYHYTGDRSALDEE